MPQRDPSSSFFMDTRWGALFGLLMLACSSAARSEDSSECSESGPSRWRSELALEDRHLVGPAAEYAADEQLEQRTEELSRSQRERRRAAWDIARRVLSGVSPKAEIAGGATLAAFQTWFGRDDLTRIFRHAYAELDPGAQKSRAPLPSDLLRQAFAWNLDGIKDFPEWTQSRLDEYRRSVSDGEKLAGLGGIGRVSYSPSAARHLLRSYGKILSCDATLAERSKARDGAETTGESARDEATGTTLPTSTKGSGCGARTKRLPPPDVHGSAPCLVGDFPRDAVIVKADFRRSELGIRLPAYDTSAGALSQKLDERGSLEWGAGDSLEDPGPEQIHTLALPNGNRFRLAALHIMTKELKHWFWITLWWSPQPDSDFGADRPRDLAGAWRNYKMCAVTAFDEEDLEPSGGFDDEAPSLAAALTATYRGRGAPSWCSNPYLEVGTGNAATNCIGCHQHAGTRAPIETILSDSAFPDHGSSQLRKDFPTDYSYAPVRGDELEAVFRETEQYFATSAQP